MTKNATLSVRVSARTREILAEEAAEGGVTGLSTLAREILERWAEQALESRRRASLQRAVSYLREHPEGWDDEPAEFFPGIEPA